MSRDVEVRMGTEIMELVLPLPIGTMLEGTSNVYHLFRHHLKLAETSQIDTHKKLIQKVHIQNDIKQ